MQGATLGSGVSTRYLEEIRRPPLLEPEQETLLAKRWREHGDGNAAHQLVTSHLRLVARIAMGYRGYGLPIAELISEGNIGLMQAMKRYDPEKGFRFSSYAIWWIKAAIQEYILRSWSLVRIGTTANQKKLFFNLGKAKNKISALEEGDLRPDQVKIIARRLGVTEQDVVDMNRRLGGDVSLNVPIQEEGDSGGNGRTGWSTKSSIRRRGSRKARNRTTAARRWAKPSPCSTTESGASSRRAAWRMIRSRLGIWPPSSASHASACARSRCAPSRRCSGR
jgi:alternative sigma factor RpoH